MTQKKSLGVAYLTWFLFGFHYVYLGRPIMTVLLWLSMFTFVGFFWWLVDAFRLPGLVEEYNKEAERKAALEQRREAMDSAVVALLNKIAKE